MLRHGAARVGNMYAIPSHPSTSHQLTAGITTCWDERTIPPTQLSVLSQCYRRYGTVDKIPRFALCSFNFGLDRAIPNQIHNFFPGGSPYWLATQGKMYHRMFPTERADHPTHWFLCNATARSQKAAQQHVFYYYNNGIQKRTEADWLWGNFCSSQIFVLCCRGVQPSFDLSRRRGFSSPCVGPYPLILYLSLFFFSQCLLRPPLHAPMPLSTYSFLQSRSCEVT